MTDLLQVVNLTVSFPGTGPGAKVLSDVNLSVGPGEATALVGPSGCGKSLLTRAVLGLLPPGAVWSGEIYWRGERLENPQGKPWRRVRGRGMALVLQEPQTSLNPVMRVGDQIAETVRVHTGVSRRTSRERAVSLLTEMLVPEPAVKADCYPHQLSGGMRQRVLLAGAMACDPALLIADEPTTALDVTVQREILALIKRIGRDREMALVFITHDAELVPLVADRQVEMSAGRIVSVVDLVSRKASGPAEEIASTDGTGNILSGETLPVMQARNLVADYRRTGGRNESLWKTTHSPVDGVDLNLYPGRALGLAGESGCGKTTLARVLSRHLAPRRGTISFEGKDFLSSRGDGLRHSRRRCQLLFQDPAGSLNPRQTVGQALAEAASGGISEGSPEIVGNLLDEVGLPSEVARRFPHELSGGQRQRVAVARCLAPNPRVLIADEPTSSLDTASRDRILALLARAMDSRGLALLLIAHDFSVLHEICDRVSVMYRGMVVESYRVCDRGRIAHPYTRALMAATPANINRDDAWWADAGRAHRFPNLPIGDGCRLTGRCPLQKPHCLNELPPLKEVRPGHYLRCPETQVDGPSHFIDT